MSNRKRYDVASIRQAIADVGADPAAIAEVLGCTRSTVYAYIRRYPEVKAAFEAARDVPVADKALYSKEAFIKAIEGSRGIKSAIAEMVGCSRGTVDNAIQRWPELERMIDDERDSIVDLAEARLLGAVDEGDMRAIIFTLETLGKARGWTKRTELTGADGAALINPEMGRLIGMLGLDVKKVMASLQQMLRAKAEASGLDIE